MDATVLNVEQTPPILDGELAATLLAEEDVSVETSTTTDEDRLVDAIPGYDGIMVHAGVPVTRRVIEAGTDLRAIARCGIGVDNVDLEAARNRGIEVVHHPTYSVQEVATHAVSLLLAGWRRVPTYDRSTRDGTWDWATGRPIGRLSEATLGIVGFGSIGRRVAVMTAGFGCDRIAVDPYVDDAVMERHNVEPVDRQTLFDRADLVSVNAELTPETAGLVGRTELDALDDNAVLANTARGPVVDTDALVAVLEGDGLGFVGLDVTDPEPLPADHPLLSFENVTVSPHTAWYSERSREQLTRDVAADVLRVLRGDEPTYPVV